ncbi:PEP-CTERM sorting domain-containing protein [Roseofilum casamattae]|uniref:PEP-CTERM sorting domain-containing protein n=1 Tax=Roseofilum casamattae BLCC-M143 TaxID=3022442 RepID=A0ABT7C2S2_9CYAN|nr:PEP-CTERM sorting domain-containing protein [Roseofilum casamattae]MDJ1185762.1 PEP-CTERM sorting domain-containing protein [Roseofilum casamattae BLCC-M143]
MNSFKMEHLLLRLMVAIGTTLAFATTATSASAQTILLEDSFNTENGGVGTINYFDFANWNVVDGSVDLIGNGFHDWFPSQGLFLDLDGSTYNAGTVVSKTAFTFNPGQVVELSFGLLGQNPGDKHAQNNNLTVSLGNLFTETFSVVDAGFITRQFSVEELTTANLVFDHAGGDNGGLALDDITLAVIEPSRSVPEPSSVLGLLALSALGVCSLRQRKSC